MATVTPSRFVVAYDQDMARLCLRRNLMELIRPENNLSGISIEEIEYFVERLEETSRYSDYYTFGNPWNVEASDKELAKLSPKKASRAQLARCEAIANHLLIREGLIGRAGALGTGSPEEKEFALQKLIAVSTLYRKASYGSFHSDAEKTTLKGMAKHTPDWVRYLSYLPGHDYWDLRARGLSSIYLA